MLMTRSVPFGVDMRVITRQIYHLFFQTVQIQRKAAEEKVSFLPHASFMFVYVAFWLLKFFKDEVLSRKGSRSTWLGGWVHTVKPWPLEMIGT